MRIHKLHDLFLEELRELYDGEQQLVKALPRMTTAAQSPRLRAALQTHLHETQEQVGRLEQIFEQLGETPAAHACDAMKGLLRESEKIAVNMDESPLRDAGLIGAVDRVKRYEMTVYDSALTFAEMLGYDEAAHLLQQTIQQERQTDRKLTQLEIAELAEQMVWETAIQTRSQAVA